MRVWFEVMNPRVSAFGDIGYIAAKMAMREIGDFRHMLIPPIVPYICFDYDSIILSP